MWQCDTSSYGGDWESGKRPKIQSGWGRFLNSFCHHGSKTRYVKSCTIIKKSSGLFSLRAEKSSSVWSGSTCSFFFCIYVFSSLGSNCIWGGCGALVPCSLWHCAFWFDILIFHLQEGLGIQPMSAGRRAGGQAADCQQAACAPVNRVCPSPPHNDSPLPGLYHGSCCVSSYSGFTVTFSSWNYSPHFPDEDPMAQRWKDLPPRYTVSDRITSQTHIGHQT